VTEGSPNVVDLMREARIAAVINTPDEKGTTDSFLIRRTALELRLPFFTTIAGAQAAVEAIAALRVNPPGARALQDYHRS
jgi:carbamoyl-phosphate synthase large subunit